MDERQKEIQNAFFATVVGWYIECKWMKWKNGMKKYAECKEHR